MRVAAVQYKARKGDRKRSLEGLVGLARAAAGESDLVVLPEMAVTGYCFESADEVREVSEPAQGPTLRALAPVARDGGCWLVCGFPERAGDRLFNSAMVLNPAGELAFTYRKTLLYTADLPWASPGDSGYRRFDTGQGSFGVGICMDLNDDRFVAWVREERLDVLAMPTNWIDQRDDVWGYWAWRLEGLSTALVAANTWGVETVAGETTPFSGESAVMRGRSVLAAAPKRGDGWIRATLGSGAWSS